MKFYLKDKFKKSPKSMAVFATKKVFIGSKNCPNGDKSPHLVSLDL
jgi:hypothetical protein